MLAKRIIPCLDVKEGRVVKGVGFVNLRDAGDPVEAARAYDAEGADELCYLDILASHEERKIFLDVVCRTAEQVFMPLTVGGGVQTLDDIRDLLRAGADKVSINTAAVANPEFVRQAAERFGTQCIVVAIDAKRAGVDAKRAGNDAKRSGGVIRGTAYETDALARPPPQRLDCSPLGRMRRARMVTARSATRQRNCQRADGERAAHSADCS